MERGATPAAARQIVVATALSGGPKLTTVIQWERIHAYLIATFRHRTVSQLPSRILVDHRTPLLGCSPTDRWSMDHRNTDLTWRELRRVTRHGCWPSHLQYLGKVEEALVRMQARTTRAALLSIAAWFHGAYFSGSPGRPVQCIDLDMPLRFG